MRFQRGNAKKYLITAPDILKVGLPCACFAGIMDVIFVLSQVCDWSYFAQIDNILFLWICFLILTGFMILGIVLAAYGYVWKIEFDDSEIIYRAISGVTRIYKIEDITRYTEKRKKQYKFYRGKKKLFQYETDAYGDIYELLFLLKERGIFAEELIPSDKSHCLVEPMAIHKILPVSGFLISTIFLIILILSGEAEIWMYAVFGTAMAITAYYTGDYLCDKTEIEDHISRKEFLKKPRIVEYSQIRGIAEYKSKVGTEYIVINVEGDKPLKIRRHNENAEVLLSRLREEKE